MTTNELPPPARAEVTGDTVLRRLESPRIELVELDGETVVYEVDRDRLHLLDAVATVVWRLFDGATSLDVASRILAETFDSSEGQVFQDVRAFAEHVESLGIVERVT